MKKQLIHFFKKYYNEKSPLLLGLSGGADSKALFHLLIELQVTFTVAHINHNWRQESKAEAKELEKLANQNNIPFHLLELDPDSLEGNLEAACRQKRLAFFKELTDLHGYQATLLGHHADDLAETVLVRLFEGSSLSHLSPIKENSTVEGVQLWRPFLGIKKKEILGWMKSNNYTFFEDHTNYNPKYMRARLRTQMMPQLKKYYKKDIEAPLCRIAKESRQLEDYLKDNLKEPLSQIETTPLGSLLEIAQYFPLHSYELKFLLRFFCQKNHLYLRAEQLEQGVELLQSREANRKLEFDDKTLYIDRGSLFTYNPQTEIAGSRQPLTVGEKQLGSWMISVKEVSKPFLSDHAGWKAVWRGSTSALIPKGNYTIALPQMNAPYISKKKISDWWTDHKIPAFLRTQIPVIWEGDTILHEFLTGKNNSLRVNSLEFYQINLAAKKE